MNKKICLPLLAALLLAGCQAEPEPVPEKHEPFIVSTEIVPTKTALDAETMSVNWDDDDELSIVAVNSGVHGLRFTKGAGNQFTTPDFTPESGDNEYFAVFPYDASHDSFISPYLAGTVDIAVENQTQKGISDASHIDSPLYGYAKAEGTASPRLAMHHLGTLVEFTVVNASGKDLALTGISLSSQDAVLGGSFRVGGTETVETELVGTGRNEVTLDVTGGTLAAGSRGRFYMTCAPLCLTEGKTLIITIEFDGGSKTVVKTAPAGGFDFAAGTVNRTEISIDGSDVPTDALDGKVVAYPAVEGLVTSPYFKVSANNVNVWVEEYDIASPAAQTAFARFETDGATRISIVTEAPVGECTVHPKRKGLSVEGLGTNRISFDIAKAENLYVEIPGLPELYIFADAPETDKPSSGDAAWYYYGPGVHEIGNLVIASSSTKKNVYVEAGALVKGSIEFKTKGVIRGRGILDATTSGAAQALKTHYASGVTVQDIIVRTAGNGPVVFYNCSLYNTMSNVRVFGYRTGNTGLRMNVAYNNSTSNSFFRTAGNCVTMNSDSNKDIKSSFGGCTVYSAVSGSGFYIGQDCKTALGNVTVSNCDIIGAAGINLATGVAHAGITIGCDGPGPVQSITFDNVRIEDKVACNLAVAVTDGKKFIGSSSSYYGKAGQISGVTFKNVKWENAAVPMTFVGYSADNTISGIKFTGCSVGGGALSASSAYYPNISLNEFVDSGELTFE